MAVFSDLFRSIFKHLNIEVTIPGNWSFEIWRISHEIWRSS